MEFRIRSSYLENQDHDTLLPQSPRPVQLKRHRPRLFCVKVGRGVEGGLGRLCLLQRLVSTDHELALLLAYPPEEISLSGLPPSLSPAGGTLGIAIFRPLLSHASLVG